jgi:hypothetical protein
MHYCEIWVDFPYLICIFSVGDIVSLIPLEKTSGGKLWAMHFLLAPSSCGVVGVPVHLLRELGHARLVHVDDLWATPSLSVRVAPVVGGS